MLYKYLFLLLYLFIVACAGGPYRNMRADNNCYHNGRLAAEARRTIYPFDIVNRVRIVSFSAIQNDSLPMENGRLVTTGLKENILLNGRQIDGLTDTMFNFNYDPRIRFHTESKAGCYYPRHAIVWEKKDGTLSAFLEICFECKRIRSNLDEETFGTFCDGKYDLFAAFFQNNGISFFEKGPVPPPEIHEIEGN